MGKFGYKVVTQTHATNVDNILLVSKNTTDTKQLDKSIFTPNYFTVFFWGEGGEVCRSTFAQYLKSPLCFKTIYKVAILSFDSSSRVLIC